MKDYGAAFLGLTLIGIVVVIIGLTLMIRPDRSVTAERRAAALAPSLTLPANVNQPAISLYR